MIQFTAYDPSPSALTASAWCIYQRTDHQFLGGSDMRKKMQVASLTKIMTAILTFRFCKTHSLDLSTTKVKVSSGAASMSGTSAGLQQGDVISIHDLIYCVMLPSGNDAAQALAESLGVLMYRLSKGARSYSLFEYIKQGKPIDISNESTTVQTCSVKTFVKQMNELAVSLELSDTQFSNAHGLYDKNNYSSARDIAILSELLVLEDPLCLEICKNQEYSFQTDLRVINIQNTNILLKEPGFLGLKTGFTTAAGGCLSSLYKLYNKGLFFTPDIIIIVLNSESTEARFSDTKLLLSWYFQQLEHRVKERCRFYQQSFASMQN